MMDNRKRYFWLIVFMTVTVGVTWAQTSSEGSHLKGWLGVDLFEMVKNMDVMGKAALAVLAVFSFVSWGVILYKVLHIRSAFNQTDAFVRSCNTGSGQLEEAFRATADYPDSPLAQILREGYLELEMEDWYRQGYNIDSAARIELAKVGIERVFDRAITNEITNLESKLILLATTTSVCPFIGLFGTVWGIMVAFQGFGLKGTVSISALAPGLSTALLTTIGGLFCAIPASLLYNYLTNQVRVMTARMDSFALELSNIIQKQIIKQG